MFCASDGLEIKVYNGAIVKKDNSSENLRSYYIAAGDKNRTKQPLLFGLRRVTVNKKSGKNSER